MHGEAQKLKKINSEQKHVIIVVNNKDIFSHLQVLLRLDKILNLDQLNILNFASLMDRVQSETIPRLFLSKIHKPQHKYSTNYSAKSHLTKKFVLLSSINEALKMKLNENDDEKCFFIHLKIFFCS